MTKVDIKYQYALTSLQLHNFNIVLTFTFALGCTIPYSYICRKT
jgi:hypothetical protein